MVRGNRSSDALSEARSRYPTMPGPGRGKFLRVSETRFAIPQAMAEESEDCDAGRGSRGGRRPHTPARRGA